MSEPSLLSALGPVLDALHALGVRHYVGGSLASSAHGIPRASLDADVVAELGSVHVGRFVAALRDAYYVSEDRVHDAVGRRSSFNLIHLPSMFKVDVFVAKDLQGVGRRRRGRLTSSAPRSGDGLATQPQGLSRGAPRARRRAPGL